jgi:hypothetical protein
MASIVELGSLEGDATKPVFRASAGGREFLVELDSSALMKLAGGRSFGDWRGAVEAQRGRIRQAAQELLESGFLADGELPKLFLTAIDIL